MCFPSSTGAGGGGGGGGDTSGATSGSAHGAMSTTWAFLLLSALSGWGCTAGPRSVQAQQPGAPLSSHEYRRFFRALRVAHHAATACHLRALYGCQNPLVRRLDEYENHGVIPKGPVCSELPGTPFFPNFCAFASYRCTMKWYFIKRTACPGEGKAELGSTGTFNVTMSSDAVLSSIFRSQPLFPTSPTSPQPAGSKLDTEVAVVSSSLPEGSPELTSIQQSPSDLHASEVTVSGQQQGQLPISDIQDLLLRLQDTHVQSLMQKLQQMMAMGKAVGEEELQAVALKLLMALNNANVS